MVKRTESFFQKSECDLMGSGTLLQAGKACIAFMVVFVFAILPNLLTSDGNSTQLHSHYFAKACGGFYERIMRQLEMYINASVLGP